jgi:hypothetical protein
MRIRLISAIAVSGLALAGVLATFCRVPAGEIIVPAVPLMPVKSDIQVLPEISAKPASPCEIKACGGLVGSGLGADAVRVDAPVVPTILVNTRRVHLNYEISDVGPSGVSAVELWATRDGKSWQRYSNEPPPSGPLVVHVAEEGRYGFSILVRNGLGLCSAAPKHGDAPQMWVEVDETKPVVKMLHCLVGNGPDAGLLFVKWEATDTNLAAKPVTICTSKTKEGPWTPVEANLEAAGSLAYQMPKDMPYEFYVRVEAADRAGNVGDATVHEAMRVDRARPRGTILGVGAGKKPMSKVTVPALGTVTEKTAAEKEEQKQVFNFYTGFER